MAKASEVLGAVQNYCAVRCPDYKTGACAFCRVSDYKAFLSDKKNKNKHKGNKIEYPSSIIVETNDKVVNIKETKNHLIVEDKNGVVLIKQPAYEGLVISRNK